MMGLEEADFEGFDNSDVTLFYTVNRIRLPFLVRLFALHRRSLQEFSITVVFVPGEFIYNVSTDQEFAYPKLACVSQAEASYQMKHLKEEMLHQFQELKSSKLSEEEARIQHLQNEGLSLKFKLKEEDRLRKKVEQDGARLTGELLKIQTEKNELVAENKKLIDEKKELVAEKTNLAVKNEELTEKLLSLQIVTSKKESVMSSVLPDKMISEVGTLLEQKSSSLEGLRDKLKILLEEWSTKQTESSKQGPPVSGEVIKELQKTIATQFESVLKTVMQNMVVLAKEVRPLQKSFKEVYSKVYTPQIQQLKKEAMQMLKEVFNKGEEKMFQSDQIDPSTLRSVMTPDMPIAATHAAAVLIGEEVFIAGGITGDIRKPQLVQVFNVSTGQWKTIPPAPQYDCEATAIDNNLVLIGGKDATNWKATNMVSTWMVGEEKWVQAIPPMNMKRVRPGVLLLNKYLFVFGGQSEDGTMLFNSFEVLDTERNQWSSGRGVLPQPLWYLKLGRYGDTVVLMSALHTASTSTNKAWKIPVGVLEESVSNPSSPPIQWAPIANTPYEDSSLLTNSKQTVLVGGDRGGLATRNIYAFKSDQWDLIGELLEERIRPGVLTISDSSFLVFGGSTDPYNPLQSLLNSVELITYSV